VTYARRWLWAIGCCLLAQGQVLSAPSSDGAQGLGSFEDWRFGGLRGTHRRGHAPGSMPSSPLLTDGPQPTAFCVANHGHLWFLLKSNAQPSDWLLCHHAWDMQNQTYQVHAVLRQRPEAMACWGDRVWIVYPPSSRALASRDVLVAGRHKSLDAAGSMPMASPMRQVFSLQVRPSRFWGSGVYRRSGDGPMDISPGLPSTGRLVGFVGSAEGPLAMLAERPAQDANAQEVAFGNPPLADNQPPAAAEQQPATRLLRLQGSQWSEIELPNGLDLIDRSFPVLSVDERNSTYLIDIETQSGRKFCRIHQRTQAGQWNVMRAPLGSGVLEDVVYIKGHLAAVTVLPDNNEVVIGYLRSKVFARLISFTAPATDWRVVSLGGQASDEDLMLLVADHEHGAAVRRIQPIDGTISDPATMQPQRLNAARMWQLSIMLGLTVSALLLAFMMKPLAAGSSVLPANTIVLPAAERIAALLIDLAPAAVISMIVFRTSVQDLFNMPILLVGLRESAPFMLMFALTMLHSLVGELSRGATLGKHLMGARVLSVAGNRPSRSQIILRNFMKAVILLIPPLALFALLNHHLQGLPDLVARTLVVKTTQEEGESTS
jgi:uncharacterized RDD family membrane protein YckC